MGRSGGALFSPEVRRDLSPGFRVPFIDGCRPRVIVQPHLRLAYHEEQVLVGGVPFDLGLASFLAQPRERSHTVGIDHPIQVIFLDISQSQDQRKELADVVRALYERTSMEDLGAGVGDHAPELHDTGVAAARCVHRQGG